jgi:hypothetical protein
VLFLDIRLLGPWATGGHPCKIAQPPAAQRTHLSLWGSGARARISLWRQTLTASQGSETAKTPTLGRRGASPANPVSPSAIRAPVIRGTSPPRRHVMQHGDPRAACIHRHEEHCAWFQATRPSRRLETKVASLTGGKFLLPCSGVFASRALDDPAARDKNNKPKQLGRANHEQVLLRLLAALALRADEAAFAAFVWPVARTRPPPVPSKHLGVTARGTNRCCIDEASG